MQLALIDALIDEGAAPAGNADNALVNGHFAGAERILQRGGTVTLAAAGSIETVTVLVEAGASTSAKTRLSAGHLWAGLSIT